MYQVEYDILSSSLESASQEVDRLQAENLELREKLSRLMSTKDHTAITNENENVVRWRTLFQKAVSKLAEERKSRVKAENEKKKALKELEIFEEDIMKRFIILRNQAKTRIKEMKAWTNTMEEVKEFLDALPPKFKKGHSGSNEKHKLPQKEAFLDRKQDEVDQQESKSVPLTNSKARELQLAVNDEPVQVTSNALKQVEKELASEHKMEEKLLEQWRVDTQGLLENFHGLQGGVLLQPVAKSDRPEKLKKTETVYR